MSGGFVDFTMLAKKGLIKEQPSQMAPDTVDFTQSSSLSSSVQPTSLSTESSSLPRSGFDFLDSFAQSAAQTPNVVPSSFSSSSYSSNTSTISDPKLDTILAKLEDTMYKIETLSSRIVQLESRIESLHGPRY